MKCQHILLLLHLHTKGFSIFKINVPDTQCSFYRTSESGNQYRVRAQRQAVEGFCDISQSLLINAVVVHKILPRSLPSTSFPIYCSLFVISMG
jgi:hypothetical protein